MISRLRGTVAARTGAGLVIDVGGVGYLVAATPRVSARVGEETTVETYLHVREDALQLYGFATAEERELFELLLGVSGIGPKVALAIVSGSPPAELRRAIVREDIARFEAIPGIGRKTAQRVVLELKDKVGGQSEEGPASESLLARDALVELGWSLVDADRALCRRRRHPVGRGAGAHRAEAGGMSERVVTPVVHDGGEEELESTLRPGSLADFVGQERVKEQLAIALDAAKGRGEALDHVLLAARRGSARPRSRRSSAASSTSASGRSPAPRSSARATSPRS